MRKIRLVCGIGFVGAQHEDYMEVEDDTPDSELWEMAEDFAQSYLEAYWEEV